MRMSWPTLVTTACLVAIAITPDSAIAGNSPVALPDSGSSSLSDTFSPTRQLLNGTASATRISHELIETLRSLQSRQQVSAVSNRSIQISPEQIGTIGAATYVEAATDESIKALEQQLMKEIIGLDVTISTLEPSPQNLAIAINASNELVADLSSEQLAKAVESPTFMALLQMLSAANRSVDSSRTTAIEANESVNILKISRQ